MVLELTKAAIEGTVGVVHVESDDMQELLSPEARKIAYEKRVELGISNAGIESMEVIPLDDKGNAVDDLAPEKNPTRWRRVFRLTPSPI